MLLGMLKLHPDNTDISNLYVVSENLYVLSVYYICVFTCVGICILAQVLMSMLCGCQRSVSLLRSLVAD